MVNNTEFRHPEDSIPERSGHYRNVFYARQITKQVVLYTPDNDVKNTIFESYEQAKAAAQDNVASYILDVNN